MYYWCELKDLMFIHGCINKRFHIEIEKTVPRAPINCLRNSCDLNFLTPKCRTKTFQQSFFIWACRLWKSSPSDLKQTASNHIFKNGLREYYFKALTTNYTSFNIQIYRFNSALVDFLFLKKLKTVTI